jgi:hypothetical protein
VSAAGTAAATSGAAAQRQIAINAIRSWGPVVKIEPDGFLKVLKNSEETESEPLVVMATGGWFSTTYSYLTSYKGLYFYTKSSYPLSLPLQTEIVSVEKIYVPNF